MAEEPIIIGNWKMYKTSREATDYIETFAPKVEGCKAKVFLAVPYTSIAPTAHFAKELDIVIGAQNMNDAREGAFTGEIAAIMLKEAGASFVLLGHSERRHIFKESDEMIHRKVLRALQDGLRPILCVGETLDEHERGERDERLRAQITSALKEVPAEEAKQLILAYEPVWAIGTGKSATPAQASEAHGVCRAVLAKLFGKRLSLSLPILYGGSVKPANATELLAQKDVEGLLVGGASLKPEVFAEIILNCSKKGKK